jgi:hypothetical protein
MQTTSWRAVSRRCHGIRSRICLAALVGSLFGLDAARAGARPVADAAWTDEALPATSEAVLEAPTSAEALMAESLERLPAEPITMKGRLTMRRPRGIPSKEFDFRVDANWGAEPPTVRYLVSSVRGELLEQVVARGGATSELVRAVGPQLEPSAAPAWNDRIQGSDVTWLDVSLGFLWWKNPRLAGEATVKGRLCDIVELEPPMPVPNCAKMRICLDRELKVLMRAEELDAQGRTTRQMWVRAVKKIKTAAGAERWMVRDIEVETRGSGHRTRLHVAEVAESAAP